MNRTERFRRIFEQFQNLGYNVVPAHPHKKHPAGLWRGLSDPDARRVTEDDLRAGLWVLDSFPDFEVSPFLFPASHPERPLVVVDVDDLAWLDKALEVFGDTDLRVHTKRGVHLYYRADPKTKITSRSWVFGERSVDVKSWGAGVMAPGARYPGSDLEYRIEGELSETALDSLPLFDPEIYAEVWREHRPKARALARSLARPETHPFVVEGDPIVTEGGLEFLGDVRGDIIVTHEDSGEEMRLDRVPIGDKIHAVGREDAHASGQIWEGRAGRVWYTDHTLGTVWRVILGAELEWTAAFRRAPDPIQEGRLEKDLRGLGIEVVVLEDEGWISDQITISEGITIIKAPHGTGKTILAKNTIDNASTAISVANTAALAEHNAERFGITCYREIAQKDKVSTTINSLCKLENTPVDVFHIDEADAVHGYLHTGKVRRAAETLGALLEHLVRAKFGLVTSADLSFEDIAFFVAAVRSRNPKKGIRVFIRPPKTGRRTIELVSLPAAKARFEQAFSALESGNLPIALGWTARTDVAAAAWGYANRREDVNLRSFWISGENSRFSETIEQTRRLGEAEDLLESADVFFFSPALQSGVSLEAKVGTVFILHTKPDFEIETVGQMLMRFREVANHVVWGVASFGRRSIRTDDCYLDGVCVSLADETDRQIVQALPKFEGEFPAMRPADPEFAWSWRITQRKIRSSYADPIKRAREVIENHGWKLIEDLEIKEEDKEQAQRFNKTRSAGAKFRDLELVKAIVAAEPIDQDRAKEIDRAYVHYQDDRQALARYKVAKFYGVEDVDEALAKLDSDGKYRKICRSFALLFFAAIDRRDVVAFVDYVKTRGKQPSEYRHALQKTNLLLGLHESVFRRPFSDLDWNGEPEELEAPKIRKRVLAFLEDQGSVWEALFGSVVSHPSKVVAWLGAQFRRSGAEARSTGASAARRYSYDWSRVEYWSRAERDRLLERFDQDENKELWAAKIREMKK